MAEFKEELSEQIHLVVTARTILRIDESLIHAAEQLTREATGNDEVPKSAVAIICAVAAIEARINYILDDWLNSQGKGKEERDDLLRNWGTTAKLTEKLRQAKGKSLKDNRELFDRFRAMKGFRDALMHHKGQNIPGERSQKYAEECVASAKMILSFLESS